MLRRLALSVTTLPSARRGLVLIARTFGSSNKDPNGGDADKKETAPNAKPLPRNRIFGNLHKETKVIKEEEQQQIKDQPKPTKPATSNPSQKGMFFKFKKPSQADENKSAQPEQKSAKGPEKNAQAPPQAQPKRKKVQPSEKHEVIIKLDYAFLQQEAIYNKAETLNASDYYHQYLANAFESESQMISILGLSKLEPSELNGKTILTAISKHMIDAVEADANKALWIRENAKSLDSFKQTEIENNEAAKRNSSLAQATEKVQEGLQEFAKLIHLKNYQGADQVKPAKSAQELKDIHNSNLEKLAANNPTTLKNFKKAKALVSSIVKQKQSASKGVEAINYHSMHPEEQVVSPMERYQHKELEEFRKNRLDKHKQILNSISKDQRAQLDPEMKFLAHREFFDQIKNLMDYLKTNKPEVYEKVKESDFFNKFNPTKLTPEVFDFPLYPGSLKGLKPEDDPEYFLNWMQSSFPEPLKEAVEHLNNLLHPGESSDSIADEDLEETIFRDFSLKNHQNYAAADIATDPNTLDEIMAGNMNDHLSDAFDSEISSLTIIDGAQAPWEFFHSGMPYTEQEFLSAFEKWNNFNFLGAAEKVIREFKMKEKTGQLPPEVPQPLQMTAKYYPTVMPYLELFPQRLREHKSIREIAIMIDKKWFNVPLEEKQEMLNFAVSLILPPEDWLDKFAEISLTKPDQPTPKQILEEVLMDEKQFHEGGAFDQFKPTTEDLIKIRSTVDKVEGKFLQKPHTPIDEIPDPSPLRQADLAPN